MTNGKRINVEYKTLVVLWFALLSSQILFLVVVYLAKPELFAFDPSRSLLTDEPLITLVFGGIALVFLILSFVLSQQHMRRAI